MEFYLFDIMLAFLENDRSKSFLVKILAHKWLYHRISMYLECSLASWLEKNWFVQFWIDQVYSFSYIQFIHPTWSSKACTIAFDYTLNDLSVLSYEENMKFYSLSVNLMVCSVYSKAYGTLFLSFMDW